MERRAVISVSLFNISQIVHCFVSKKSNAKKVESELIELNDHYT